MPYQSNFDYLDALCLNDQLTEEERTLRDQARIYCTERLMPRVTQAFREESKEEIIFIFKFFKCQEKIKNKKILHSFKCRFERISKFLIISFFIERLGGFQF